MKLAFHPWLEAAPAAGNPAGVYLAATTHSTAPSKSPRQRDSLSPPPPTTKPVCSLDRRDRQEYWRVQVDAPRLGFR